MEKIKKYSIINFICSVIICCTKLIQTYLINQDSFSGRRISLYLGLFLTIPALIISVVTFISIIFIYKKNNNSFKLKENYLLIPFIIISLILSITIIIALFKSLQ